VIICHVAITTADDYVRRRAAHREAHLTRLTALRQRGVVIGGGPAPDGKGADIVYRVQQAEDLTRLLEEDPYWTSGAWTGWQPRGFAQFLEPWELPPVVTDGSRPATIVEGEAPDVEMASLALIEARGGGRMAFGGFFSGGTTWVLMRSPDAGVATAEIAESGFWKPGSLTTRPLLHVL